MGAEARLAVAEHPRALRAEPVAGGDDVLDFIAQMMHAAGRVALEKTAHRRAFAERLEQFDLVLGNSTKTTVTPCAGKASGAETRAPRLSR